MDNTVHNTGKVPFVSFYGIHQLHIFIFVLAVSHVLYCITTLALGRAKAHLAPQSQINFDFQMYIKRSLEEDFKVVVGISSQCHEKIDLMLWDGSADHPISWDKATGDHNNDGTEDSIEMSSGYRNPSGQAS
ncbi:hypothetical protein RJ639_022488 [Escallonia herrerae]|uniref:Uncharacterized protein n=1 Tax=Escallonia herrerae TaxID=1293975 RepID=A0AA88V501_9ASTE|nr:hypothetical protein RJ639_022488 [Escallonia herrerae]